MKYLIFVASLLQAEPVAPVVLEPFKQLNISEKYVNIRVNESHNLLDYSSRVRLIDYGNFSSGVIWNWKTDIEKDSTDSSYRTYIQYKF
jgi:hypothetical protein